MPNSSESSRRGVIGSLKNILGILKRIEEENLLEDEVLEEGLSEFVLYKKEEEEGAKYLFEVSEKVEKFIREESLEAFVKFEDLKEKYLKLSYEKIKINELENRVDLIDLGEKSYYIGEGYKLIITTPKSNTVRRELVRVLQKLTNGNLSSVSVGKLEKTKRQKERYVYQIDDIGSKAYLSDLKELEKEYEGIKVFYELKEGGNTFIEMGYRVADDVIIRSFFEGDDKIFLKRDREPLEELIGYSKNMMLPLFDLIDLNLQNEKNTPLKSYFYEIDEDDERLRVDVSLSVKNSLYNKGEENLSLKIENYQKDLEMLKDIQEIEKARKKSAQIVVLDFTQKEELARILSLFTSDLLDGVKMLTFQIGSSEREKFYVLYIKEFRIAKNPNIVKIYNLEKNFSYFKMNVFVEEGRYIYPFFAMDKIKEMNEEGKVEEDNYYKMFLGSNGDVEEQNEKLEALKSEETIAIIDNSKRIFNNNNLIFFNSNDFKSNVIEIYNESLLSESTFFEDVKKEYYDEMNAKRKELEELKGLMQENFFESKEIIQEGYKETRGIWNSLVKDINNYEKNIEATREKEEPKLKSLFKELREIEHLEGIKETFNKFWKTLVTNGTKLISEEKNLISSEDDIYSKLKNNWEELERKNKSLKVEYQKLNNDMSDFSEKTKKEVVLYVERLNNDLEDLKKSSEEMEKSLKEILLKYEK